jgi:hypothetical protein
MNLCKRAMRALLMVLIVLYCKQADAGSLNNNLFKPYDILLFKSMPYDAFFDFDIAYEGAFHVNGFQADPDDRFNAETEDHTSAFRRKVDAFQLWQTAQEFFPALSGTQPLTKQDTDAHEFNIRQQRIDGSLRPKAEFNVPTNLMFAARFALPWDITLGFYLPVFFTTLKHVTWHHGHSKKALPADDTFTGLINREIEKLERAGKLNLRQGWKRHGVGDFAALAWWWHDYPQAKQWLKNVRVGIRSGLTFPTGSRGDLDKFFQLPFGHDGGVGILVGGTLELGFGRYVRLGIDGEFLNLFGSVKERRFMTDNKQTDLIFLSKQSVHIDPGFTQHYTLYLKTPLFFDCLTSTLAYQHTRQHQDSIALDIPKFDVRTINDAESLQDWTTHSIVWKIDYDTCSMDNHSVVPGFSFFVKSGFNGKRALLFDTVGAQINLSY